METIKIIIPSIGRPRLDQTLYSILQDSQKMKHEKIQTYVVSDGRSAFEINKRVVLEFEKFASPNFGVTHLLNPGKGVSAALNCGLTHIAPEDLFLIFTDDDEWLPGRIEILLDAIRQHPTADLLLSRAYVTDENGIRIRPRIQIGPKENILHYLYAKQTFRNNPSYFSLVTMIAKGHVAKTTFSADLTSHEDVVWLSDLQLNHYCLDGVMDVTAKLHVSLSRSAFRMKNGQDQLFFEWFGKVDFPTFSNYLWVHAQRANCSEGNFFEVLKAILSNFKIAKPSFDQILIAIFQIGYAAFQKIKKVIL